MKPVRVRFAPSPTGLPHIGNTRTALFAWLLARQTGGRFIVRVEDTDQKRYQPQSLEKILEILEFLELDWDEGPRVGGPHQPYFQSQRLDHYQKIAQELIDSGVAYYCFCSSDRLEKLRREQKEKGQIPKYDRHCLSLSEKEIEKKKQAGNYVVRLKMPENLNFSWKDLVQGEITINSKDLDDQVLLKSDGYPTYHLAVVVDDHDMKISHVIRGVEWISSTPKHLFLYQSLGWPVPALMHLPLILGPDKAKLSKRHGAKSVLDYRDEGYLKEALINFMVYLGWSYHDNSQILTKEELIKAFDYQKIQKQNAIFDIKKLDWFNGQYIRMKKDEELAQLLKPFAPKEADEDLIKKIIPLVKERLARLSEFRGLAGFFFLSPEVSQSLLKENVRGNYKNYLKEALLVIQSIKDWQEGEITRKLMALIKKKSWQTGDFFMALRIVIAGSRHTPPINDSLVILGKEETIQRLQKFLKN
ncbi:MAG: glutamate--tRNA ligase [Candidatus Shapirobacteria bacterium]|nr:glutamate--tRNA ligase [Candidatus Shapirobacteria bacterium]